VSGYEKRRPKKGKIVFFNKFYEKTLKHFIGGKLNAGNNAGRSERCLFDLNEIVGRIAIQNDAAHGNQGKFFVGPNFGQIEWVPSELGRLFECHHLQNITFLVFTS
jgi:hypothetical protein